MRTSLSNTGQMTIPFLLFLSLSFFTGISVLALITRWKRQVHHQLRLDHCVGTTARSLAQLQNQIETQNRLIQATRLAIAAASFNPSAIPALKATLKAQVLLQESFRQSWNLKQITWLSSLGCDGKNDFPMPLPNLGWTRNPPDLIGEKPLIQMNDSKLTISLSHQRRIAVATVKNENNHHWIPVWGTPIRTSLP